MTVCLGKPCSAEWHSAVSPTGSRQIVAVEMRPRKPTVCRRKINNLRVSSSVCIRVHPWLETEDGESCKGFVQWLFAPYPDLTAYNSISFWSCYCGKSLAEQKIVRICVNLHEYSTLWNFKTGSQWLMPRLLTTNIRISQDITAYFLTADEQESRKGCVFDDF